MLRQAFEESFQVKEIQRNVNGEREGLQRSVSVRPSSSALGAKRQLLSHFHQKATTLASTVFLQQEIPGHRARV